MLTSRSLICVFVLVTLTSAKIPDYIKVCKQNDENPSECILNSINKLKETLKDGIEELGVPSLEPLRIDDMSISNGLNLNVSDVLIRGASSFELKELKAEIEKNRFAILVHIPEVNLEGIHSIDMELLTIPFKGSGKFKARFTDFNLIGKLKGKRVDIDEKTYLKFDSFDIKVVLSGVRELEIEDLFKDNPTLSMAGAAVVKDNVQIFLDELMPAIEQSLSSTLTRVANQITTHFTFDELFPL